VTSDEFMARFKAAEELQNHYRQRLNDAVAEKPASSEGRSALLRWRGKVLQALGDYRQWGEGFVALIDSAPAPILAANPGLMESKRSVLGTLQELDAQLL
jgi:hypothetical protein